MKKLSKLLVLALSLSLLGQGSVCYAIGHDKYSLASKGLREAYKYEKEVKSYQDSKSIQKHQKEADKLAHAGQELIKSHAEDADQLKRKSFEQLDEYVKKDELFSSQEFLVPRKLVFISLSQNTANLEQLIKQAKANGFIPVMRGFKDDSYVETAKFFAEIIKKTGYGIVIDPDSFKEFAVQVVPTFVVASAKEECADGQSCIPAKFNKIAGNVSFDYVLRLFASSGDKL
jgi:type-F conjugative transfer system pilin assembly protein TrbC